MSASGCQILGPTGSSRGFREGSLVKKITLIPIVVVGAALVLSLSPGPLMAKVTGRCDNCHTMHASQSPWPANWSDKSLLPQQHLLATAFSAADTSPCVGCHSSSVTSTYYDLEGTKVPVVFYTGGTPPDEYLAGGNFWWVKEGQGDDDTKGHNVFFNEGDDNLADGAPGDIGFANCGVDSCHSNLHLSAAGVPTSLLGKYGCEGCHINVRHHADDHGNFESGLVNTAAQGWYRFLWHHSGGAPDPSLGVEGFEDGEWEAGHPNHPQGGTDHNEYLGKVIDGGYGFLFLGNTTTAFCTGCHGVFHSDQHQGDESNDDLWIRHPSDAVIPDEGEYADVGGASHLYDPLSPVAKATVDDTPDATVSPGSDMVMCLSCHRAHGSPYSDLLRWDYEQMVASGGGDDRGCFYCHTQKNDG